VINVEKRTVMLFSATMPEGCTVNSETDRGLFLRVDKAKAAEVSQTLREIVVFLEAEVDGKP
jgi:hypothetical protein